MASFVKGVLEPKSAIHPEFGRIKKAFIAYVHNPDEYEVYVPPFQPEQLLDPNILNFVLGEKQEHESRQKRKIAQHTSSIRRLANYLLSLGVPIVYDEYWRGKHVTNQLQEFESQIVDSDFVLLIINTSMNHYLRNVAPIDEEIIFTNNFLFNLMTVKKPSGTEFIPVFVNSPKIIDLIPVNLASASSFSLMEPFDCQTGDMCDLYRLLTNQATPTFAPSSKVVSIPPRKTPFGVRIGQSKNFQAYSGLYERLKNKHEQMTNEMFQCLSTSLASHWQQIAHGLGFTEREIKDCEMKSGVNNAREACYQMLCYWETKHLANATIAHLAHGIKSADCGELLKYLII